MSILCDCLDPHISIFADLSGRIIVWYVICVSKTRIKKLHLKNLSSQERLIHYNYFKFMHLLFDEQWSLLFELITKCTYKDKYSTNLNNLTLAIGKNCYNLKICVSANYNSLSYDSLVIATLIWHIALTCSCLVSKHIESQWFNIYKTIWFWNLTKSSRRKLVLIYSSWGICLPNSKHLERTVEV